MIETKQHKPRLRPALTVAVTCVAWVLVACSEGGEAPAPAEPAPAKPTASKPAPAPAKPAAPEPTQPADPAELAKRGRTVYMANCIACHNQDPTQDGALGPAIAGSPRPLIEARVMRGEYPEGYTPKRPSKVMIPLPHLEGELDALAAFLAAAAH